MGVKTLQMTMTQAVKCRRLAGPKSLLERPFYGRDSCDEKKSKKKLTKKQKLTGSSPRTHEAQALQASPSRNCRCVRPSPNPPRGARRHRLVCRQVERSFPHEVQACFARNAAELLALSWDRAGAAGRDPSISEREWPILEPTRVRCATLSTSTELQRKITTNPV